MATEQNHALETFGGWREEETEFTKELAQMELVASHDDGGGYEWDVFYVYYHTGRERYYYISDSGCSCNWVSDGVSGLGDFRETGDKHVVAESYKSEYGQSVLGNSTYNDIINHKK